MNGQMKEGEMPDTKKKLDIGYTQQLELELCKDGAMATHTNSGIESNEVPPRGLSP